jgi:hypothetical protein
MSDNIYDDDYSDCLAMDLRGNVVQLTSPQEIMTCYLTGQHLSSAAQKIASNLVTSIQQNHTTRK